jgi:hypothetical protein
LAPPAPYEPPPPTAPLPPVEMMPFESLTPNQPGPYEPGPHQPTPHQPPQPGQLAPGGWPVPPTGWEQLGPPAPARRNRRAPLIAAIAVAAVIGGGTATILAVSDSHSGFKGAASPEEAVSSLVSDLNKSDLLGVLDHLAPGERDALLDPLQQSIAQSKRLHVLKSNADPGRVPGVAVSAKGITFDKAEGEAINDHVRIVKITAGTITLNADLTKVPFTDEYLKVVFPHGIDPSTARSSATIDIASAMQDNGPVRIATQQLGGKWYPSLMYTIADLAVQDAGADNPGPSDYVAPKGAPSPEDAVKQAIMAIQNADYRRLIELASPSELPVVHDYGGVILKNIASDAKPSFTIKDLQLRTGKASGATRVTLHSITVDVPDHEVTVAVDGNCLGITRDGDFRKLCAIDIINELNAGPLRDRPLTAEEKAALGRFASGVPNIGVEVSSSGGQWFIDPVRSYLDMSNALVEPLHDNDLILLLKLLA